MHIDDIRNDLSNKDLRGIEDAFRALIGYPNEAQITGSASADVLSNLLHEVAVALEFDTSIMPNGTFAILDDVMRGQLMRDATDDYASGSTIVRQHTDHFHQVFERHA